MNPGMYFLVVMGLPLLISGDSYWNSKTMEFMLDEIALKNNSDDFIQSKLIKCVYKFWYNDTDFLNCSDVLGEKTGIMSDEDQRFPCCRRVIYFKCWETLLTTKCNVSKEEVEKNDDLQFKFWNDAPHPKYKGHCEGDKTNSLKLCNLADNGSDNLTWSIAMQLTGFTLYLLVLVTKL